MDEGFGPWHFPERGSETTTEYYQDTFTMFSSYSHENEQREAEMERLREKQTSKGRDKDNGQDTDTPPTGPSTPPLPLPHSALTCPLNAAWKKMVLKNDYVVVNSVDIGSTNMIITRIAFPTKQFADRFKREPTKASNHRLQYIDVPNFHILAVHRIDLSDEIKRRKLKEFDEQERKRQNQTRTVQPSISTFMDDSADDNKKKTTKKKKKKRTTSKASTPANKTKRTKKSPPKTTTRVHTKELIQELVCMFDLDAYEWFYKCTDLFIIELQLKQNDRMVKIETALKTLIASKNLAYSSWEQIKQNRKLAIVSCQADQKFKYLEKSKFAFPHPTSKGFRTDSEWRFCKKENALHATRSMLMYHQTPFFPKGCKFDNEWLECSTIRSFQWDISDTICQAVVYVASLFRWDKKKTEAQHARDEKVVRLPTTKPSTPAKERVLAASPKKKRRGGIAKKFTFFSRGENKE